MRADCLYRQMIDLRLIVYRATFLSVMRLEADFTAINSFSQTQNGCSLVRISQLLMNISKTKKMVYSSRWGSGLQFLLLAVLGFACSQGEVNVFSLLEVDVYYFPSNKLAYLRSTSMT